MHTYLALPDAIATFLALVYGLNICVPSMGSNLRRARVGVWHISINLAVKPLVERALPWVTLRLMLLSSVVSCIVFSYPLYLLLAVSRSVLPPAAFHRTINALWRVPQFVTRASDERRYGDVAKAMLIS